ncbi:MAG TPA: PfkB family carbohydrate kinase [Terriglobales bacterium]|nr:PfkB family carbohydrate kinase [Terriglobales bacterium]
MSLLVVGSVAFDDITTPRGRAPRVLGGSGTYFGLAASFFTAVRLVGVVGEDFTAEDEAVLTRRGIDVRGLEHAPGKCFCWAGEYEANPNNRHTLRTELNVFEHFAPKLPPAYLDSEYLFLGNIAPALQCQVRDQLGARAQLVGGDTMNFWITGAPKQVRQFLSRLHLLTINDQEAQLLTGEHNLHRAARAIIGMGPEAVVIKRGEHGATLYHASAAGASGTNYFGVPGYPLEDVFDPTGAGDAFAGGMLGYLAQQGGGEKALNEAALRRAVVYGSVLGSFACERFGVERLTEITSADVEARYREFVALTRFDV